MLNSRRGFSLVELMIVLAIIALLASIAIPMYLNILNRTKQTRTMANMRAIATAWEQRAADFKQYNAAGATFTLPRRAINYPGVRALLSPTYIKKLPQTDGWGHPLEFHLDQTIGNRLPSMNYSIRSPGRNGIFESRRRYTIGPFDCFDCDIVFSDGTFIAWPEGQQR